MAPKNVLGRSVAHATPLTFPHPRRYGPSETTYFLYAVFLKYAARTTRVQPRIVRDPYPGVALPALPPPSPPRLHGPSDRTMTLTLLLNSHSFRAQGAVAATRQTETPTPRQPRAFWALPRPLFKRLISTTVSHAPGAASPQAPLRPRGHRRAPPGLGGGLSHRYIQAEARPEAAHVPLVRPGKIEVRPLRVRRGAAARAPTPPTIHRATVAR